MHVSDDLSLRGFGLLTSEQERAVAHRHGGVVLAAGAGSGKTAVLVERFVRAVLEDRIAPARILAITFTDRAAGELTERLRHRFLELGEPEAARELQRALVGTFHGFCGRLLRLNALAAGVAPDYRILDETEAVRLRATAFASALKELVVRESDAGVELLAAYGLPRLQEMVLGTYAELRSRGELQPRLPALPAVAGSAQAIQGAGRSDLDSGSLQAAAVCELLDALLADFSGHYEGLKRGRGGLDFDDLELRACRLLAEHEQIRQSWRERLELLMVDELQDVNRRQLAVLESLERDNLFTVGDELQSIYGFRHADVSLFRARRAELTEAGRALELTHNFRARAELLEVINAIFAPRFGERYAPLHPGRGSGDARPADGAPVVELLFSDRDWEEDQRIGQATGALGEAPAWRCAEARLLAQRIADLIAAGHARAEDVAVLVRAATGLGAYVQALEEQGVPTVASAGDFWEQPEVRDLLCYLRVLANPLDEVALYSTLASPLVELSSDGLAGIARTGRGAGVSAWEAARRLVRTPDPILPERDHTRVAGFRAWLEQERRESAWRGVAGTLRRAIEASECERRARERPGASQRIANIRKLVLVADRFEREVGTDLRGFLEYAELEHAQGRGECCAQVAGEELAGVRLMTIHAAKGSEFPVVCVAELGARPSFRTPDLLTGRGRVGLRLAQLGERESAPALEFETLAAERRRAQEQEEDRILYVALTRARERLLLSGVVSFKRWPETKPGCAPLAWLGPALVGDVSQRLLRARELEPGPLGPVEEVERASVRGVGVPIRFWLNTPTTFGKVLRRESPGARTAAPLASMLAEAGCGMAPVAGPRQEHARSPADGGGLPSELSYTALTGLERCGYRYYLQAVLGIPETQPSSQLSAHARGELIHRALRSLDFSSKLPVPSTEVMALARELGLPDSDEYEAIANLLGELRRSALAGRLSEGHLRREVPFAFALGIEQPTVTGVIDALVRESEERYLVVDYKSDRVHAGQDLEALVEEEYAIQRLIYGLAALHDGARVVEVVHWFLHRPREWVSAVLTAAQSGALHEQLRSRVERAYERGYPVSERPNRALCGGCPGRGTLCSWSEEETLRPRNGRGHLRPATRALDLAV